MSFMNTLEKRVADLNTLEGKKRILLIDGDDSRALKAALKIQKSNLVTPVLLLTKSMDTKGVETLVMTPEKQAEYALKFFEMRQGKETIEASQKAFTTRPFYAAMLLKEKIVDGVVGGLAYTTGDILRAAFKVIGAKSGVKTISSVAIMAKQEEVYLFSDISVNVKPNALQLAEIGLNAVDFAKQLKIEPTTAFLSFSTTGSAITDETKLVQEATQLFNAKTPQIPAIGEVQFDAALDLKIRSSKYKGSNFATPANIYVFPDLNAGNIGYKIAQRLGKFEAIGPIITGIRMPINDLSRGATVTDVYGTILITTLQTQGRK